MGPVSSASDPPLLLEAAANSVGWGQHLSQRRPVRSTIWKTPRFTNGEQQIKPAL